MHVYWIGVAADLWRAGDKSLEWMLREAMAGEVFAAGHSERGNDLPLLAVDMFVLAVFAWALLGFGNTYYGMSQRASELAAAGRRQHVPRQRARTAVPRCPLRALPPCQPSPGA